MSNVDARLFTSGLQWSNPKRRESTSCLIDPEHEAQRPLHTLTFSLHTVLQDYFAFEAGSREAAKARGINEETYLAIKKWLKDNP
jgi:hypothetical protein